MKLVGRLRIEDDAYEAGFVFDRQKPGFLLGPTANVGATSRNVLSQDSAKSWQV